MADPHATFKSAVWNHAGKVFEYRLMCWTSVLIPRGLGVHEDDMVKGTGERCP
jgi:hypothetical protein